MLFSALMFGRQRPCWASFRWDQPKDWPRFIYIASDFEWNVGFILMASQKVSEIFTMCCCRMDVCSGEKRRDKTGNDIQAGAATWRAEKNLHSGSSLLNKPNYINNLNQI